MAHPKDVYAFNECSLACCIGQKSIEHFLEVLDRSRAWIMMAPRPMLDFLTSRDEFDEVARGRRKSSVELLLEIEDKAARQVTSTQRLTWKGRVATGLSVANSTQGGCAISWPCSCSEFDVEYVEVQSTQSKAVVSVRHASSVDHLLQHWRECSRLASQRQGRPRSVKRIDKGLQGPAEVPHVHFTDGSALNVDGAWKHGYRSCNSAEMSWLASVGWAAPQTG